jgi:RNase H-fold protein (predicted Holliday junction resolvase)
MTEKTVLAIDPGSSKCGLAVVRRDREGRLELVLRKVVPTEQLTDVVAETAAVAPYSLVIMGSGTKSKELSAALKEARPQDPILMVDEKETTMEARERYWEFNPRRGWRRLFPSTMLTPPDPVDDFVALILAERVLEHSY